MKIIKIFCYTIIGLIAVIIGVYRSYAPHLNYRQKEKIKLGEIVVKDDLFTDQELEEMKNEMQKGSLQTMTFLYHSNHPYGVSDLVDGKCPGKYDHIDRDGEKCILSGRVDIAKHALLQGGSLSQNYQYDRALSKINSLSSFLHVGEHHGDDQLPMFMKVIKSQAYQELVEPICGFKNPYLGNINPQVTIIQPGQEFPQHYDVGQLLGIDSTNYPQWLIIAMKNSGLYEEIDTPAIQGVTYLHSWDNQKDGVDLGGQLRSWNYGPNHDYISTEAIAKRAVLFDGGKIPHQTVTYKPWVEPILYSKNSSFVAFFNSFDQKWDVYDQQSGILQHSIDEKDARLTIVWRQQCFKNEEQANEHERRKKENDIPKVEDVVENLLQNLVKENIITKIPETEIEKAELIIDHYIQYAFDKTKWFPYNICILLEFSVPKKYLDYFNFNDYC